jgi:hypothetical protein
VLPVVGLFSQLPSGDANPFASAQKIYLKYCSSDSWLGDAPASATTFNYAFRGARIVAATIASLQANHGLGSSAGQQLLLGGCSAGARGAISSLDAVAALIPGVDVRGFFDAAGWVDIVPAVQGLQTLQAQAALQVAFMEPPLPASCTAIYSGDELWKCIWPSYLLPMLTTPFFLNAAQVRQRHGAAALLRCCNALDRCVLALTWHSPPLAARNSSTPSRSCIRQTTRHRPRGRAAWRCWTASRRRRWRCSPRCRRAPAFSPPPAWRTAWRRAWSSSATR